MKTEPGAIPIYYGFLVRINSWSLITIWRLTLLLKQRPFSGTTYLLQQKSVFFRILLLLIEYQVKMQAALADFHQWAEIAQNEWPWLDLEETREFELDSDALFAILNEYSTDEFWSMR